MGEDSIMDLKLSKTKWSRLQECFHSGQIKDSGARRQALKRLKSAIEEYEDAICEALYQDLGKSKMEGFLSEVSVVYTEINHTLKHLEDWMADDRQPTPLLVQPGSSYVVKEPKGVVLIIAPWNYPFQLLMAPLIAALAAGNVVLAKPAHESAHTARVLETVLDTAFPDDLVTVIQGEGAAVIPPLIEAYPFDHIFFTGSPPVGRSIMRQAATHLTPVTLELGGKSPGIVDKDANIKVAARRLVHGKFINAGQTCIAPDHLWVHESVRAELITELKEAIRAFFGDDPQQSPDYGRLIHDKRMQRMEELLEGAEVLLGGGFDTEDRYMEPTLVDAPDMDSPLMQEEIFGPIWPVLSWSGEEELISGLRQNAYPLACYIFTSRSSFSDRLIGEFAFGGGCVNNTLMHLVSPDLPFGGVKTSGMGAYHGKRGFDTFTHEKSVLDSGTWVDPPVRYPPYNEKWLPWVRKMV
jgi:aldehyde dehydrogenase (NAD+)